MKIGKVHVNQAVDQIVRLCAIPSPSGFTAVVSGYLRETFRGIGLEPIRTRKGSVLVDLGGTGDPLVLAAHVDTLGGMVRSAKPNGRIRITKIGGFSEHIVEGENCTVFTGDGRRGRRFENR